MNKPPIGFKEEITDILTAEGVRSGEYKKGNVLKFGGGVSIRITRLDKKNGRAWGEHVVLVTKDVALGHYGHETDKNQDPPFCLDCRVSVGDPATPEGEEKVKDREENYLEDGTKIE